MKLKKTMLTIILTLTTFFCLTAEGVAGECETPKGLSVMTDGYICECKSGLDQQKQNAIEVAAIQCNRAVKKLQAEVENAVLDSSLTGDESMKRIRELRRLSSNLKTTEAELQGRLKHGVESEVKEPKGRWKEVVPEPTPKPRKTVDETADESPQEVSVHTLLNSKRFRAFEQKIDSVDRKLDRHTLDSRRTHESDMKRLNRKIASMRATLKRADAELEERIKKLENSADRDYSKKSTSQGGGYWKSLDVSNEADARGLKQKIDQVQKLEKRISSLQKQLDAVEYKLDEKLENLEFANEHLTEIPARNLKRYQRLRKRLGLLETRVHEELKRQKKQEGEAKRDAE